MKENEFQLRCPDCGELAEDCKCVEKLLKDVDEDEFCAECGEYMDECDCEDDEDEDPDDWKGEKD